MICLSNIRKYLALAFCLFSQVLYAGVEDTDVSNQAQFDAAVERINKGEEMHISLGAGQYRLKKNIVAKAPLSIKGEDATITCAVLIDSTGIVRTTASHNVYKLKRSLSPFPLVFDVNGKLLELSESVLDDVKVNYIDGDIVAPDVYTKGTALKIPLPSNLDHLKNKKFGQAFGYFDCGWRTVNFRLDRTDSKYLYCTTLNDCATKNYNYDKKAYRKPIRMVLYNAELKENAVFFDDQWIYVPKSSSSFYCLENPDTGANVPKIHLLSDATLEGVSFVGFNGVYVNSKADNKCSIINCQFHLSLGVALDIYKKKEEACAGIIVSNCIFKYCSLYSGNAIILSTTIDGRNCIQFNDCTVSRYPDDKVLYKNAAPALSINGDISLTGNVSYNSSRGQFGLNRGNNIVKNNFLFNTDGFNKLVDRNLSSDWGLIYCNHVYEETNEALNNKDHVILIEGNLLYGAYSYGEDAHGIYIDDGRGDVTCKNNIILNTQLYSLDSRNVRLHDASSARNVFEGNIVSSRYRLVAGPALTKNDAPKTKANILLVRYNNVTSGTQEIKKDSYRITKLVYSCEKDKVSVSRPLYKILKQSSAWKKIKEHIVK